MCVCVCVWARVCIFLSLSSSMYYMKEFIIHYYVDINNNKYFLHF